MLANVLRISDLARAYEMTGGFSFRGFIEELNAQAEKTESPEAPVLEEASDCVRMMSVHAAKGLEFPVVILADMTANLAASEADRYVDAEPNLCATRLLRHCSPRELLDHADEELGALVVRADLACLREHEFLLSRVERLHTAQTEHLPFIRRRAWIARGEPVCRRLPALRLHRGPSIGQPERGAFIAAIRDELCILAAGHEPGAVARPGGSVAAAPRDCPPSL